NRQYLPCLGSKRVVSVIRYSILRASPRPVVQVAQHTVNSSEALSSVGVIKRFVNRILVRFFALLHPILKRARRLRSNQGLYFFDKFTHGFKYLFPCSMIKPASTIAASTGVRSFFDGGVIRLACIALALIGWVLLRASSICCCIFGG